MTEPQGGAEEEKPGVKVCPSCHRENELVLKACWKCGAVFGSTIGGQETKSSRAPLSSELIVVSLVLFIVLLMLARSLPGLMSGGGKPDKPDVLKTQDVVNPKSPQAKQTFGISKKLRDELLAPIEPGRAKADQAAYDAGASHFLVTSLPKLLVSRESRTVYFEGLMASYLKSNDGSALLGKKELMLGEKYPAVEYKVSLKPVTGGSSPAVIHHAITAVVADKAYTVSVDYPEGLKDDGSAMKKNLLDSLP